MRLFFLSICLAALATQGAQALYGDYRNEVQPRRASEYIKVEMQALDEDFAFLDKIVQDYVELSKNDKYTGQEQNKFRLISYIVKDIEKIRTETIQVPLKQRGLDWPGVPEYLQKQHKAAIEATMPKLFEIAKLLEGTRDTGRPSDVVAIDDLLQARANKFTAST